MLTDEWTSLIVTAKPNFGAVGATDWILGRNDPASPVCKGIFNDATCDVCLADMTPTCTVGLCEAALASYKQGGTCSADGDGEGEGEGGGFPLWMLVILLGPPALFIIGMLTKLMCPSALRRGAYVQPLQVPAGQVQMQQPPMMMAPQPGGMMAAPMAAPVPIQARVVGQR